MKGRTVSAVVQEEGFTKVTIGNELRITVGRSPETLSRVVSRHYATCLVKPLWGALLLSRGAVEEVEMSEKVF